MLPYAVIGMLIYVGLTLITGAVPLTVVPTRWRRWSKRAVGVCTTGILAGIGLFILTGQPRFGAPFIIGFYIAGFFVNYTHPELWVAEDERKQKESNDGRSIHQV